MHSPVIFYQKNFTATGKVQLPEQIESVNVAFQIIPQKWALQVTGLDNSGTLQTPTAWDVIVEPSLDGQSFNDMTTPILEHVNTVNGIGDVVWSGASGATFRGLRMLKINVKTLTLGASATKILVTLMGII